MSCLQAVKWCGGEYLVSSGGNEDLFVWRVSRLDADYSGLAIFCEGVFPDKTPDCDLRITDFDVGKMGGGGEEEEGCLEITLAFSNSVFKTYRYRSSKAGEDNRGSFELLATGEYTGACLTQVRHLGTRGGSAVSDVLTASTDGHIALWTPDREKQSFTLACAIRVHQSSIKSLDMHSPSGSDPGHYLVMTTGDDNALAATSVKAIEAGLAATKGGIVRGAHAAAINGVVCLPDGRVATASNDQRVKIWEVRDQGMERPWAVLARDLYSGVADAGAAEYLTGLGELLVGGVGMEVWRLYENSLG
jgi:WD40 repeat protein